MHRTWMRGLGLVAAVVMMACGGPVEEAPVGEVGDAEQALRLCDLQGRCAANEVCVGGPGGTCYPCDRFPQYCEIIFDG